MEKLDRSRLRSSETSKSNIYMDADNDKALEHFVDSDKEIEESTFFKKIVGSVQKVIGNKSLTQDDLKPVLSLFKQRLMEKNVAGRPSSRPRLRVLRQSKLL
jgi:hypothetical protein